MPTIFAALATSAKPTATANSPLFKLSGELRNSIYRLALLTNPNSNPNIATSFSEPPLLKTSKLIRAEAASIFYLETSFHYTITNNNSDAVLRWDNKAKALGIELATKTQGLPSTHWRNLVTWVERYRLGHLERRMPTPLKREIHFQLPMDFLIVGALFDIAKQCRGLKAEAYEEIMESQRVILGLHDRGWLVEHD